MSAIMHIRAVNVTFQVLSLVVAEQPAQGIGVDPLRQYAAPMSPGHHRFDVDRQAATASAGDEKTRSPVVSFHFCLPSGLTANRL